MGNPPKRQLLLHEDAGEWIGDLGEIQSCWLSIIDDVAMLFF